jgi:nitrogen fixation protein NifU and related proteins
MDLRELYQEVILDHNKRPRNRGALDKADAHAEGHNPLCGDHVEVFVRTEDGRVVDVSFEGTGCAISTASASLMTEAVKGKTIEEAERIFREFQKMVTAPDEGDGHDELGTLQVLAGVRDHPVRIKCATLAWHTLHSALVGKAKEVSTEQ